MIVIGGPPGWFVGGLILIATVAAAYGAVVWMSEQQQDTEQDASQPPTDASSAETKIGPKIAEQLEERGWTPEAVIETVANPTRIGSTTDDRRVEGVQRGEPATAYGNEDGSYVVRNDRTGDIVQVSDRTDPSWRVDPRIKWK